MAPSVHRNGSVNINIKLLLAHAHARTSALGLLPPDLCRQKVVVPHKVVLGGAELAEGAFLVLVDGLVLPVPPHQQQLILEEQEVPPSQSRSEARHLLPPFG